MSTTEAGLFPCVVADSQGTQQKGSGTTHGADQPLFLPCAIPRHVLSTILAANSTPKKMQ
jgi:hypothetical protein